MADYDWGKGCCGMISGHALHCKEHPDASKFLKRNEGYHYDTSIKAYFCRRGCGTLVWDTDAHSKNVCTTFEPVVK